MTITDAQVQDKVEQLQEILSHGEDSEGNTKSPEQLYSMARQLLENKERGDSTGGPWELANGWGSVALWPEDGPFKGWAGFQIKLNPAGVAVFEDALNQFDKLVGMVDTANTSAQASGHSLNDSQRGSAICALAWVLMARAAHIVSVAGTKKYVNLYSPWLAWGMFFPVSAEPPPNPLN